MVLVQPIRVPRITPTNIPVTSDLSSHQLFTHTFCCALAGSFASAVDNVRALQSRMAQPLRKAWPMVWEASVMPWETYGYIACSGMRALLFRVNEDTKTHLAGVKFVAKQGAQPAELGLDAAKPAAAAAAAAAADAVAAARSTEGGAEVAVQGVEIVDAVMDVGGQVHKVAKDQAEAKLCGGAAVGSKVVEMTASAAGVAVAQ
jgi:hypothetical protein